MNPEDANQTAGDQTESKDGEESGQSEGDEDDDGLDGGEGSGLEDHTDAPASSEPPPRVGRPGTRRGSLLKCRYPSRTHRADLQDVCSPNLDVCSHNLVFDKRPSLARVPGTMRLARMNKRPASALQLRDEGQGLGKEFEKSGAKSGKEFEKGGGGSGDDYEVRKEARRTVRMCTTPGCALPDFHHGVCGAIYALRDASLPSKRDTPARLPGTMSVQTASRRTYPSFRS